MKKDLAALAVDFSMIPAGFTPPTVPMLTPHKADEQYNDAFLAQLTELEKRYEVIRAEMGAQYIAAVCPYRAGDVLAVDTNWVGRRRLYYKGAQRFLVKWIRPFYWTREGGEFCNLFINLYGCYLSETGEVLRPELNNGLPMQPGEWQPERISLNTGGHASTILGLADNQAHQFEQLPAAGKEQANPA